MTRNRQLTYLAVVTAVAAVAALIVNAGIGRLVALPEGAAPRAPSGGLVADVEEPELEAGAGLEAFGAVSAGRAALPRRALSADQYLTGILDRNIFDFSKIGVEPDMEGEVGEDGEVESDLNVTLVGTMVAEPERYSTALLLLSGNKSPYPYSVGQRVLDSLILKVERYRVQVERGDGRVEWISMGDKKDKPTSTAAAAPAAPGEEVRQVAENHFAVDRATVQENLSDLEGLSRMARALLHRGPDGEFDGYRLSAIRRGSLPDKLGIRNGDIVHTVNGMDLNSVQGAMQALQALQNESRVEFTVTRRGAPVSLTYDVE